MRIRTKDIKLCHCVTLLWRDVAGISGKEVNQVTTIEWADPGMLPSLLLFLSELEQVVMLRFLHRVMLTVCHQQLH
jgi:hypothetical protein